MANAPQSSSVVDQPTLTRSEWLGSTPIASSTGDGSMLSDEQADPEWTATPARSRPISTGSASTPCTPRQTSEGRRSSGEAGPTISTPSTTSAALEYLINEAPGGGGFVPHGQASRCGQGGRGGPKREERGNGFQSAAASAFLLAADEQRLEATAPADHEGARTWYRAQLVRAHADQVGIQRTEVGDQVAAGCRGIDMDDHACLPAQIDHLVHGLECPHLVVGPLAVDQGGSGQGRGAEALAEGVYVDVAGAVDREGFDRRGAASRRRVPLSARPRRTAPAHPAWRGSHPRRPR